MRDTVSVEAATREPTVTATVELSIANRPVRLELTVPSGRARLLQILPVLQTVAEAVVKAGIEDAEQAGEKVSCDKGCGACCRQLVPISTTEAHRLREVVEAMPPARRAEIVGRFAEAGRRLDEADLISALGRIRELSPEERQSLGLGYFELRVACPFLEEESCSIYLDRPIACREYLVTSPPTNCAKPSAEGVRCVKMPARVSNAATAMGGGDAVALILALQWAATHPEPNPDYTGPELVRELFAYLAKTDVGTIPA